MTDTFDLEELVHLEQTFYDAGYADGFAHGRIHGLIEGRALGRQKGFEIWEEIGFYEGFALTWKAVYVQQGREDQRAVHHINRLLNLIRQFPTVNPSPGSGSSSSPPSSSLSARADKVHDQGGKNQDEKEEPEGEELDMEKLERQIRSRYKALCARLGVRPTLRANRLSA